MSSSSTRIAESWRQNLSPSGNRVKHRGQTFTLRSDAELNKSLEEAVGDGAGALGWLDVEQSEFQADIELLAGRELDPGGHRDLKVSGRGVEIGDAELGECDHRQWIDRVGGD